MNGLERYRMSMVSKEWHDYCTRDTVLMTSNLEFENACSKRDILSILMSWEHFKSHPMFGPEYTTCKYGNVELVDILIKHGMDYSWECYEGACKSGNIDVIRFLYKNSTIG